MPEGVHPATWAEVEQAFAYNRRRAAQFDGLRRGAEDLRSAGCARLWLDGSYVTIKPVPGDFDVVWDPTDVEYSLLAPALRDMSAGRRQQKLVYGGEFLPNTLELASGQLFLDFFQNNLRTGGRKGVIEIDLKGQAT